VQTSSNRSIRAYSDFVAYSPRAVQRIVDRVRVTVSRPAKDARVNFTPANVTIRSSQSGRTIDAAKLRSDIKQGLVAETDRRILPPPSSASSRRSRERSWPASTPSS